MVRADGPALMVAFEAPLGRVVRAARGVDPTHFVEVKESTKCQASGDASRFSNLRASSTAFVNNVSQVKAPIFETKLSNAYTLVCSVKPQQESGG
jgi:hypothetical protein